MIDLARVLHRRQKLIGYALDKRLVGVERLGNPGNRHRPNQLRVRREERRNVLRLGRLADHVRHIQGKEVAGIEEALHRLQVDVVRVEKVRLAPAHLLHCHVRRGARLHRLGANDGVLAVRLVPHRNDLNARVSGLHACGKLGLRLVGKAVAHANGKLR